MDNLILWKGITVDLLSRYQVEATPTTWRIVHNGYNYDFIGSVKNFKVIKIKRDEIIIEFEAGGLFVLIVSKERCIDGYARWCYMEGLCRAALSFIEYDD